MRRKNVLILDRKSKAGFLDFNANLMRTVTVKVALSVKSLLLKLNSHIANSKVRQIKKRLAQRNLARETSQLFIVIR